MQVHGEGRVAPAWLGFAWNAVGLLDLVIAVGTGTGLLVPLLMPELGPRVSPAAALGAFPTVLIPANVVPLSVITHVLALGTLVRGIEPGPRLAATTR